MLITRGVDYAMRILRVLAEGGLITGTELCEKAMAPQQFAYKILKKMEGRGYIKILRGSGGGYQLNADLRSLTLYDLVDALEKDRLVSACVQPGFYCAWRKQSGNCRTHKCLLNIQRVLDNELRAHSLYDVLFGDALEMDDDVMVSQDYGNAN
ncbi:MAG: Rrf2 family transcriptional regulator [Clostridiales bacterium]|jgi:Rrf2 family protein|nr:Rrf2 family transcriptional regulator [Clostridiales bacterium]